MKKALTAVSIAALLGLAACQDDATIASHNLSKAADNFEVLRRVVFINGITGDYLLSIEGLCSIVDQGTQLEVTCKDGNANYKKHFLGLSDNVTYLAEQMQAKDVSVYHTRITFKPQSILPDVDFRGNAKDLVTPRDETD
jgi:hypothetical protein